MVTNCPVQLSFACALLDPYVATVSIKVAWVVLALCAWLNFTSCFSSRFRRCFCIDGRCSHKCWYRLVVVLAFTRTPLPSLQTGQSCFLFYHLSLFCHHKGKMLPHAAFSCLFCITNNPPSLSAMFVHKQSIIGRRGDRSRGRLKTGINTFVMQGFMR